VSSAGATQPLELLCGQRVAAFCGIGNPDGFKHTLSQAGGNVVAWREFPDHHAYDDADFAAIAQMAARSNADVIVCTQKDLVKVQRDELSGCPLWAVCIKMQFLEGQGELEQALANVFPIADCGSTSANSVDPRIAD
jgi:tetraacyldisaccharide 4'-kinase